MSHRLRLVSKDLLNARPLHQAPHPFRVMGVVFFQAELALCVEEADHGVPRHKGQIGKGELAADEVGRGLEDAIQDGSDAVDFFDVAR